MKFTEEQYQKIVEIADEYQSNSAFGIIGDTTQKSIGAEFYETELNAEIDFYENAKEIMAIVNPLTRELAHDKFVEKEKKYVWNLKKQHKHTDRIRLFKDLSDNSVSNYWTDQDNEFSEQEELTESEIKAWGYNPDMFDREEAQ